MTLRDPQNSWLRCGVLGAAASLAMLVLTMVPRTARADEESNTPPLGDSITIEAGWVRPDRGLGTSGHGFTGAFIYDHPIPWHLALEADFHGSIFETGKNGGTDFYQKGLDLDLVYQFDQRQTHWLNPFALIGVGAARDDWYPDNLDRTVFLYEAGLGVITGPLMHNGLRLRIEGRYVRDQQLGGHGEPRVLAGFFIPLGWGTPPPPPPPPTIEIREVVREVVKEVPVPAAPPPSVDSDGDGVDDAHDKCPNTPRGARVDAQGCVIEQQTIELKGVTFNVNKATLTPNAEAVLDLVVRSFTGQPSLHVEVAGHTDGTGSPRRNLALSQQRAESVRDYLIAHGAHPEQLSARGYGDSQLLVNPELSEADRQRNRRVELRIRAQ
jgi:OmpA-OmpF porin, OOP family